MNPITNTIVLALRGGSFTAPIHAASVSPDGRWVRVPSDALVALDGATRPDERVIALSTSSYGRSWAIISGGAVVATAEQAVQAIRSAMPALQLAQRIVAGLVPAQPAPAADAADGDSDLSDLDDD
jgi:hypothetical protein